MNTVLITGATGFLGKYLCLEFLRRGYTVLGLGRREAQLNNLEELGVISLCGDFTDKNLCPDCFKDVDTVVHAGALSSPWGQWDDFLNVNVEGTRNVCELCLKNQIKKLVYISSPSVYTSRFDRFDITEDDVDKNNNLNFYIRSKIMAEDVVRGYAAEGIKTVIIRPRGLFGIGDTSLVPRLMRANEKVGIPLMRKDSILIDVTCVENVAYACYLACIRDEADNMTFNITNGEPRRFTDLVDAFMSSIGSKAHYFRLPYRLAYGASGFLERVSKKEPVFTRYEVCTLAFSQTLDISKAKSVLDYEPIITIDEGITQYGEWYKNQKR